EETRNRRTLESRCCFRQGPRRAKGEAQARLQERAFRDFGPYRQRREGSLARADQAYRSAKRARDAPKIERGSPRMAAVIPDLKKFRRVVVKVGSSLLVDSQAGTLHAEWLSALVDDLSDFKKRGASILVVTSGAIALGRTVLKLPKGELQLEESQAAAAVGQIALARIWAESLAKIGLTAGQVLLTLGDTEERRRYLNARETIGKLIELGAVPVINENDTVATSEIRYGDNDRLAARVAAMASADLLILLSDIDGLYDAPPSGNPKAKLIPIVERITPVIEAMAGGAASELSRGGMRTKIEAARIAIAAGVHMAIADGRVRHPIERIAEGGRCTWFLTPSNPLAARKIWIGGSLELKGAIYCDPGAV